MPGLDTFRSARSDRDLASEFFASGILYSYVPTKQAYCTTLQASGDHVLVTPATGNRLRLLYVTFTPSSDNTNSNLVKLGFGATGVDLELYRAYAAGHGAPFEGTKNQSITCNTATAESVAVTVHFVEFT